MSSGQRIKRKSKISSLIGHFENLSKPSSHNEEPQVEPKPKYIKRRPTTVVAKENKVATRLNRSLSWDAKYIQPDLPKLTQKSLDTLPVYFSKSVQTANSIENVDENKVFFKESNISTQTSDSIEFFENEVYFKKPVYENVDIAQIQQKRSLEEARKEAQNYLNLFENTVTQQNDKYDNDYQLNNEDSCSNHDEASDDSNDEGIYENLSRKQPNNIDSEDGLYDNLRYIDDDEDVYVTLRRKSLKNSSNNIDQSYTVTVYNNATRTTRTTIYDSNHTPRIQDISSKSMPDQKHYIIDELISSEEIYINSLDYVIRNYMRPFRTITSGLLVGKCQYIFLNIEYIYLESKVFLQEIKQRRHDYQDIGKVFKRHRNLFERYPVYLRMKNQADELVNGDFRIIIEKQAKELGDKLGLSSHLLKPVQRLGKYELLLKKLAKQLNSENKDSIEIDDAINLIQSITRRGNDLMMLDMIKNNPCTLNATGEFIMKSELHMLAPKRTDVVLFLFYKKIIIASKNPKTFDQYCYKNEIDVANLGRKSVEEQLTFTLLDYQKKNAKHGTFVFEANSLKIKGDWITEIDKLLWMQLHKRKEDQMNTMSGGASYIQIQQEQQKQQDLITSTPTQEPNRPRYRVEHNQEIAIEHTTSPEYAQIIKQKELHIASSDNKIESTSNPELPSIKINNCPIANHVALVLPVLGIDVSTVLPSPTVSESSVLSDSSTKCYKNSIFYDVL